MPDVKISVYAETHGAPAKLKETETALKGIDTQGGKANTALGGLWKSFALGQLAANAVGGAIKGCADFIKGSVSSAIEAEDAENNLRAALESTGRAVEPLAGHLLAYSNELQNSTTFEDDAIQGAQALLVQLTDLDEKGLDEATKGAIGLASVFKIDLESAARAVAQGFEGNYTALGRMIPAVRDAKTESGKLAAMQDGLAQMFARAKAETGTFGGALKQLKNAWDDVKEGVGGAITQNETIIELIKDLKEKIEDLVKSGKIEEWAEGAAKAIKVLVGGIELLGDALSGIPEGPIGVIGKYIDHFGGMEKKVDDARRACVDFRGTLEVLKPSLEELRKESEKGPESFGKYKEAMKAADDQLAANKDTIVGWIEKGAAFLGLNQQLPEPIKNVGDAIKELSKATTKLLETWAPNQQGMIAFSNAAIPVRDVMAALATEVTTTAAPAARNLAEEFQGVADTLPNIPKAAKDAITTVSTDFGQLCTDIQTDWGNTLNTSLQEGWGFSHFLKEVWGDIWQNFGQLISDMAAKWVMDFITPTVNETKKIGDAISESVKGPVSDIAESAGSAASGFLSALGSVGSIITAITSVIQLLKGPQKQTDVTYWLKLQWELLQNSYNFYVGELTWKLDTISNAVDKSIKPTLWAISTAAQKAKDYLKPCAEDLKTISSKNYLKDVVGYLKSIDKKLPLAGGASGAVSMQTQLMMVHGTPSDPEYVIRASQLGGLASAHGAGVSRQGAAQTIVFNNHFHIKALDGADVERVVRYRVVPILQNVLNHDGLRVPTRAVGGA